MTVKVTNYTVEVKEALKESVENALATIGLFVEGEAKQRCRVDTGNTRGSISHEVDGNKVTIGSNVHSAIYLEKGTGKYAVDGDGRQTPWKYQDANGNWRYTEGSRPYPFLTPAIEDNISKIGDIAKAYIGEGMK
jgi:hypothetical protein